MSGDSRFSEHTHSQGQLTFAYTYMLLIIYFILFQTVNVPTCFIGKEKLDGVEYMPNEVQNPVYLAVLKQAYLVARLFLGPFQRVIDKDNGSPDLLKKKLDSFFSKVCSFPFFK